VETQHKDERALLRRMIMIRAFEAALRARPDHGFQLLSSGQEAVSVGVCAALTAADQLLCSGRSIGPALARGLDPGAVMAELVGKTGGLNQGKAGRGHMAYPAAGFFGAHAVVGGNLAIAAGVALAFQVAKRPGAVVCLFGDGACGAGALHETLNIAAVWRLPLVLVCDNNGMSVSTPRDQVLAPRHLADLATPFGVPAVTVDGMDVLAVRKTAETYIARARAGMGPAFLECISERFSSHSTSTVETRSQQTMAAIRARCPIARFSAHLAAEGLLDTAQRAMLEIEVAEEVTQALACADSAPYPDAAAAMSDVV